MPLVMRKFFCRQCSSVASLDQLTSFMSVVECTQCELSEILNHEDANVLDHFDFKDLPYTEKKWMN